MPFVSSPSHVASPLYVASPSYPASNVAVTVDTREVCAVLDSDILAMNWWFDQKLSFDASLAPALFDSRGMGITTLRASAKTDIYQWNPPAGNNYGQVVKFGMGYTYLTTGYGPTGLVGPTYVPNGVGSNPVPSLDNFAAVYNAMSPKPRVIAMVNFGTNAANTDINTTADKISMLEHYYDLGVNVVAVENGNEEYANAAYHLRPNTIVPVPGSAWAGTGTKSANAYAQNCLALMDALQSYTNADPAKQAALRSIKVICSIFHEGTPDACVYTPADDQAFGDGTGRGWTYSVIAPTVNHPQCGGYQYHSYTAYPSPGYIDADLFTSVAVAEQGIISTAAIVQSYYTAGGTPPPLWVTEFSTNGTADPSRQSVEITGALYAASAAGTLLRQPAVRAPVWFANGARWDATAPDPGDMGLYGTEMGGDFGVVAQGDGPYPYGHCYPAYYGLCMVQHYVGAGDTTIRARSDHPLIFAYAAKRQSGHLTLMLVNGTPRQQSVSVTLTGYTPAGPATLWRLAASAPTTIQQSSPTWSSPVTIPAYTVDVYDLS